ncbi:multidrug resistance-associated protein 1 isoform X2 [Lingula anatina]|uniref:ABC-type glutathione-S-conjugate transporter n=1 Tax=Lingula anatina TaxID=7574 RepID=A0A1S3JLA4_LINAN|nr:multidrug resistance-associated protein 1 isoform X2 [Lingula anatina]|eukprot:XP_013411190.1 multidrug resistance-associated protein 1 isoform X2 [Lingula anatina]
MEAFCGSPFWDYNLTINTDEPDLTSCFQNTVLVWIPCFFLVVTSVFSVYSLLHSQKSFIPWTWLNITKTILGCVLVLLAFTDLCNAIRISAVEGAYAVSIVSPGMVLLAMSWATALLQLERKRGIQSSGQMFFYWLLWTLGDIFICVSKTRYYRLTGEPEDMFTFVTFFLHFPVVIAQLILSVVIDKPPVFSEVGDQKQSPEKSASFLSKMSFWWFTGMVIQGYRKPLESEDLWSVNKEEAAETVVPQFYKHWKEELSQKCTLPDNKCCITDTESEDIPLKGQGKDVTKQDKTSYTHHPALLKALFKAFGFPWAISLFGEVTFVVLVLINPQLLKLLIGFTQDKDEYMWKGLVYAALIYLCSMAQSLLFEQLDVVRCKVGFRMRSATVHAVYRKALVLSNGARKSTTVGEIVNLMSVDATKLDSVTHCFSFFLRASLKIVFALYFLWQLLGPCIMGGLGVMLLLIPVNGIVAKFQRKLRLSRMDHKDNRIKLMNEILNGMKVLKLYAWETSFEKKIMGIREKEMISMKHSSYLNAISSVTWALAPYLLSLSTFAVYVLSSPDNILTAERAFVALSLFQIMSHPLSVFPAVVNHMVQVSVAIKRLTKFLKKEELDPDSIDTTEMKDKAIVMKNGTFTWDKEDAPTLKEINLDIDRGQLVAVVGSVGTGKSSLLSALLGNMDKIEGTTKVSGSVAYVPQQAWIQNCSLRDNILFNNSFDESEYNKIIDSCALNSDLEILPSADKTEIGEKGINLSGGQKQRVSLARAVYSNADIYLLDDPLSAVDAHVGKHIFQNVIGPEGVLKNKTRILVTHGISHLPKVDKIIVIANGSVSECGTFSQLMDHQGAFSEFLKNYLLEEEMEGQVEELDDDAGSICDDIKSQITSIYGDKELQRQKSELAASRTSLHIADTLSKDTLSIPSPRDLSPRNLHPKEDLSPRHLSPREEKDEDQQFIAFNRQISKQVSELEEVELCIPPPPESEPDSDAGRLIQDETAETGRVKFGVFIAYIKAVGVWMSIAVILFHVLEDTAEIYSNVWLSQWSNDPTINGTVDIAQRDLRLGVYGAIAVAEGLVLVIKSLIVAIAILWGSRRLHNTLLTNVLRYPQSFFDTTPTGRITNRFAKDIDVIDGTIPYTLIYFFVTAFNAAASIVVISYSTPIVLTVVVPLAILYYLIQRFFIPTSRQLRRIESVASSPIYSHFGETLSGVSTIRAFRQQKNFILQSEERVDNHLAAMYINKMSHKWLATRLQFIGNCIVFAAAIFAVLGRDTLTAGIVGLSVTYAMNITGALNGMVHVASELEANIVAVERVKEYSEYKTEAEWSIPEKKPDSSWPHKGEIVIDNYSTRYRQGLPLAVKNINCHIKGGEKIGIVGRTGAGKSSLTLALFRIIEPAEGKILIDGTDISEIGLHDLRSKITVIPQDPVLFSGSLRMNLDPFDQYTDQELWMALEHAHLKNFVASNPEGLSYECSEGGENLSVGQRQLVCLARALLRKTKVLVLDEATAAVDLETDDLIQSTIRTEFAECTVLTIAHRLNTIMDYTRILVLGYGEVKEFASPQELLADENGIFHSMAKDAGLLS